MNYNYVLIKLNSILNEYTKKYNVIDKINTLNKLQNKEQIFKINKYSEKHNSINITCEVFVSLYIFLSISENILLRYGIHNKHEHYKNCFPINKYINRHYKNKYGNLTYKQMIKMFKTICNHYINIYKQKFDIKKE